MGILIGLLTALTWGGADFSARFSTHRIGTLRTMFYMPQRLRYTFFVSFF